MDDQSWRMLLILLEGKKLFALMTIADEKKLSCTYAFFYLNLFTLILFGFDPLMREALYK